MSDPQPQIGIIMGSDSDLPTMKAALEICEQFDVPYEVAIVSAHRTPERMVNYAKTAHERGLKVIIAGAGGAAHLPGMVASLTPLPVIGVPVATRHLGGLDSLYSIVQMPRGIPVATVAIGNAQNAGLLAVQILGSHDPNLLQQVQAYRSNLAETVLEKQTRLADLGHTAYLAQM
ncbi:MAG: 5-(carboxyamino)imidazole ribonucleotide mutase [Cyanobacteria bacterium SID2]|nr:5-(carboxyamino)imidazole ribonucleotide mutase [Cyanobacteria bacterium SID2]MBP0002314.1 5-(carboxyamino)imidazole ribonucleotide mutase [Cyanobacteria bacterium SBC]